MVVPLFQFPLSFSFHHTYFPESPAFKEQDFQHQVESKNFARYIWWETHFLKGSTVDFTSHLYWICR
jgi:hypothetical protein